MGTWGPRPYDNDTAADWFSKTLKPTVEAVEELIQRPVEESNYAEYSAAAWLMTKICRTYVYDASFIENHLSTLHDRLQTMKADLGYIAKWQSPTEFLKDLEDQIVQLQRVCKWNNITITF